jgi:two-component system nitrogen regulation response regulator NtrX
MSPRAGNAFVRVNSAAIPTELVESEMFGHERGSFTGAFQRHLGKFELADGGTLFLDEVADLNGSAQSKLLRALESGEIERIGAQHAINVDVRVIAATNRDLAAARAEGNFRDDLYYRLNVIRMHMPPLRARVQDLPELVDHFMSLLQRRHGLEGPLVERAALAEMQKYAWPGNVRELANVCERLAILYSGRAVTARDIRSVLAIESPDSDTDNSLSARLDDYEREMITSAIAAAHGNIADAARRLETDRANLYRRMRRLGMDQ